MARLLDDASSQAIVLASALGLSPPFSIGLSFYPDDGAIDSTLMGVGDSGDSTEAWRLRFKGASSDELTVLAEGDAGPAEGGTSNAAVLGAWNTALAIFVANNDRTVVLNGDWANRGTETTTVNVSGANSITVGRRPGASSDFHSGRVAEIAVWDVDLKQHDAEIHGMGFSPLLIKRSRLKAYLQVLGNGLYDVISGLYWQLENGPIPLAAHPQVFLPGFPQVLAGQGAPAAGAITFQVSVSSAINFGQYISREFSQQVFTQIAFAQDARSNIRVFDYLENTVEFVGSVIRQMTYNRSLANAFLLEHVAKKGIEDSSAASVIAFLQEAARGAAPSNLFALQQSVAQEQGKPIGNQLNFGQAVTLSKEITLQVSNTINFGQSVRTATQIPCDPGIPLGIASQITLTCSGGSVTLRNPEFGNSEQVELQRAFNETRGGDVRVFRDSNRPNSTRITITVRMMTSAKAAELLTFLRDCIGQLTTFVDENARSWTGIILNPDTAVTADRADDTACGQFTAQLEMIMDLT